MLQLSNEKLKVIIAEKGAELQSIQHTDTSLEYLWSGDPAFWGKKSPVLFPIVGGLKDNRYTYNGNAYTLPRHGFARDHVFSVVTQSDNSVTLELTDTAETMAVYPFHFNFRISYTLHHDTLSVVYMVANMDEKPLLFSVGAHPAFKVPLAAGTTFEDYHLFFNKPENAGRWPLSPGGQIESAPVELLQNTQVLPLTKQMFYEDALVFKHLSSDSISILSDKTPHGLEVSFPGFPFMGIWSAKDADFVCIEPWCGIADSVTGTGKLEEKEGVNELGVGEKWEREWTVRVF